MVADKMHHLFENALSGQICPSLSEELKRCISLYDSEQYPEGYALSARGFYETKNIQEKSIFLHLTCVFLENIYDLPLRNEWMAKWPLQLAMDESSFTQAAHQFHLAVSCYFESYYSEAEIRFKEILTSNSAPRFKALAHFHLGLIYRNRQLTRSADIEMRMALKIATEIDNKRLIKRSCTQIMILANDMKFSLLDQKIRQFLQEGLSKKAKKLYLEKRRIEKTRGLKRERQCLHSLLPVFAALKDNWRLTYRLLEFMPDYSMKLQCVSFIRALGKETSELIALEKNLQKHLAINILETVEHTGEVLFLGRSLGKIESPDLARFAQYLYSNKNVTKEGICQNVWNLSYDPVIHDSKIYKLIHQFRNYFGVKDILINRYGSYEINQRYRA